MSDELINIVIDDAIEDAIITVNDLSGEEVVGPPGPPGPKGDAGAPGPSGKSAYQLWLEQGNSGTVDDFLASLKGDKGDPGDGGNIDLTGYATTTDVSNEATERANADSNLQSQITVNTDSISAIQTLLSVDDADLDTLQEVISRLKSDEGLISSLNSSISDNTTAINSEVTSRTNADASLQSQIDANTTAIAAKEDKVIPINNQTASYTAALTDANKLIRMNLSSAGTFTVPPNSSVAFPAGTQLLVSQTGSGQVTITAGSGVTINSAGGALKTRVQYSTVTLIKTASPDTWLLSGDITS